MSAVTERQWIERRREMDRRAWDAALAKREMVAAVAEWHPLTPDPVALRPQTAEEWRYGDDLPYRWRLRDRLVVGAIIGAGCAMWLWLTWRCFERLTR